MDTSIQGATGGEKQEAPMETTVRLVQSTSLLKWLLATQEAVSSESG